LADRSPNGGWHGNGGFESSGSSDPREPASLEHQSGAEQRGNDPQNGSTTDRPQPKYGCNREYSGGEALPRDEAIRLMGEKRIRADHERNTERQGDAPG
jgi:hypothetical protein